MCQFLHHQHQVGLSDFIPSGIQQPGILSLVPEKTVQPIAGGYGIRIRIVVALDRHMVIANNSTSIISLLFASPRLSITTLSSSSS